ILPGSDVVTGHRAFPASLDLGCGRSQRCDFNNLLVFYDDGFGNSRCFYRKDNTSGAIYTVAYEHEQREIGELVDFFECADKVLDYFDE
ncbi:MAG: hypothetical protein JXB88_22825, partial [Spirochaetales bacterium]|nr:hypothetical protein [Spirochaetales bacterium]